MPLFFPQVAPFILQNEGFSFAANSAGTGPAVAGSVVFASFQVSVPVTVSQMRTAFSGTPTGNCDMGIYDASGAGFIPGNLLGHTGAIAATTGMFTKSLTANLLLSPGKYWLAFLDTVADTVFGTQVAASGMGSIMKTSATGLTVLPATAGTVADYNVVQAFCALQLNGWS